MALSNDLAAGLVDGYVSVMTCAKMSGVRCLRMEEIDRRARRENLASNNVTALSNNGKLPLISNNEANHISIGCRKGEVVFTYQLQPWPLGQPLEPHRPRHSALLHHP